jgi:hypothetical protein
LTSLRQHHLQYNYAECDNAECNYAEDHGAVFKASPHYDDLRKFCKFCRRSVFFFFFVWNRMKWIELQKWHLELKKTWNVNLVYIFDIYRFGWFAIITILKKVLRHYTVKSQFNLKSPQCWRKILRHWTPKKSHIFRFTKKRFYDIAL